MAPFAAYGHAIASLAGVGIVVLILAPTSALAKYRAGFVSGGVPNADYADRTYRIFRAHLNLTESIGTFVAVTMAAILAGASSFWVNLFASLFFLSRVAQAIVHVGSIGAADFGPRTYIYAFSSLLCWLLALMAICSVFADVM